MSAPDAECPLCQGTGFVEGEYTPPHPPSYQRCDCVVKKDILANVERGMKGLSSKPRVESTPLLECVNNNLWITAGSEFFSHLRHVAIRQPTTWAFKVTSDAELMTAWLASIALKGQEILDPDAYMVSTKYITIPDLVLPPDLLVIRMGVKAARNSASAEVLAEALNTRFHEGKPTWIWDQPNHPLNAGHLFWSDEVARVLSDFGHIKGLTSTQQKQKQKTTTKPRRTRSALGNRKTLRGGGGE